MTTFPLLERSVEDSRPVELYEFTFGTTVHRFTSYASPITIAADTYAPEAIQRGRLSQGSDQARRDLVVTVPSTNVVAMLYVGIPPADSGTLRIFRVQPDEVPSFNTVALVFSGRIQTVKYGKNGTLAGITCRTIESDLAQRMPRFSCMGSCNNFLYDQFCKIDPTLFNLIGTVTAESGADVTVSGVGGSSLDFVGGMAKPTSGLDYRTVRLVSGDVLTLEAPFSGGSLIGETVQVFAGCDHLIDGDCALVFDNVIEFGGFAFVPKRNIFQSGLDV